MQNMIRFAVLALVAAALLLVGSPAFGEQWFHVRVNEGGDDPVDVSVNLPLGFIEAVLEVLPDDISDEISVELNDAGFSVDELRDLWQELRSSPDATFVTVKSNDETVEVSKSGEFFIAKTVDATERGTKVDVKFPLEVIDALFSGSEGQLDLAAAVRALADHGGNFVTVHDDETTVRVWVDDQNEAQ